ncbi:TPA: hypothetical protein ACSP79_003915, partial [Aeromonas veronii]
WPKHRIVCILYAYENSIALRENRLALLSAIDKIRCICTYIQPDAQKIEVTVINQEGLTVVNPVIEANERG